MPYSSTARTQYGNQKLPMAIQSNISGLTLFRSKFLSGKNNIQISPSRDSKGYSVGRQQLQNGITIFNITVPHWETYKLPLNDRDKYRIYRNGCWHESMHVKYTPDEVYTFGAKPSARPGDENALNEPLAHDMINIIEDRRIEDLGVKEWKGSKRERLFSNAYAYTRRMKVDEFFNLYLKQHYDFAKGEYIFPPNDYAREKIIRTRIANMRHEAFLQRFLVKRIKGHENLPHAELRAIDKEARMVEKQLEKIEPIRDNLKERHRIFTVLANLSMKVIRDLGLQFYTPQLTKVGESSWDQSFDSTTVNPGDEEKTRAGIDDYFDEMMSIEVVCADCGAHYSKKLGVRE